MSVEENKAVAKRWNEKVVTGDDLGVFDELLHEEYVNRGGSQSSWAPKLQGIDEAKAYFAKIHREHPTWRVVVDDIIGEEDRVAARVTFMEEGKPVANAIVFNRFADGKIIDDWYCSRWFDR